LKFSLSGGKKEEESLEEAPEETGDVLGDSAPEAQPDEASPYDELRERLEDIQARLEQIDSSTSALRSEIGQLEERIAATEGNVRELLSMYEIATRNQNPFFESSGSAPEAGENLNVPAESSVKEEISPAPDYAAPPDMSMSSAPEKQIWQGPQHLGLPRMDEEPERAIVSELTLEDLDNSAATNMLVLRWIEYIMQRVGYTGLSSTLDYYVQIGWISREAAAKIMSFSTGIDLHGSGARPPKKSTLSVKEHLVSLYFVTKLKKERVFDNVYLSVKEEVEKLGLSLSSESA